ncbi:hypothetical protein [Pedobacter miscanthi]|uniref:Uncharacterized protein n=1 Tax=Pedobacter miscanthi TaxID=2259170 RepID=A0A366L0D7_9SPHI|nr:hypothetical protein [Pedobacter miscanthi]RBQ06949.1 hypothetical protein DRW42_12035 [Pedobacter miscanthi]
MLIKVLFFIDYYFQSYSIDFYSATINFQPYSIDFYPATINFQPYSIDFYLATINFRSYSIDFSPATINFQPYSIDFYLATINFRSYSIEFYLPASISSRTVTMSRCTAVGCITCKQLIVMQALKNIKTAYYRP